MSATNVFETDILELIFNNTAIANVGDTTGIQGSSTAGNVYVALFETDPGETGSTTDECDYTGYSRVAVARTSGGWTITGNTADNTAAITFGECTTGDNTATHFGIMKADAGSDMLFYGALNSSLNITNGVIPEFAAGDLDITAQ